MKNKFFVIVVLFCLFTTPIFSQVIIIPIPISIGDIPSWYEHGYLPGKKFPFYSTINKYDFNELSMRVELNDNRYSLNLSNINCSDIQITNDSEFKDSKGIHAMKNYIEKVFEESNINIDSLSETKLEIRLEALDVRLIGFGSVKVHGLCQMTFKYMGIGRTYCIDIVDGDKKAPLSNRAITTRKTAERYMLSASMREVIEQFLIDLNHSYFLQP